MTALRIHFTIEDMANIRIARTAGPMMEAFFAIRHVGNSRSGTFAMWRKSVYSQLRSEGERLAAQFDEFRSAVDFLRITGNPQRRRTPGEADHRKMAAALRDFHAIAVAPYWSQMFSYLSGERDQRMRILAGGGFEQMFSTLHPKLQWHLPTLEISGDQSSDIKLDGRGLIIVPSIFQQSPADVLLKAGTDAGPPVLIYSAPPDASASLRIWRAQQGEDIGRDGADLEPLLGRTRATVLRTLTESCTTSELAQRVHISAAAASQHATILREAGLITSRRIRNRVLHGLTPLGMALAQGKSLIDEDGDFA